MAPLTVLIVGLLALTGLLGQLALGQAVSSRAANPDEPRISASADPSGHARNMYSQKLSGHRMMHFGKRPLVAGPPALLLEQPGNMQALDLGRGQQPFFSAPLTEDEYRAAARKQHLMEIVANLLEISRRKDCDEQEQRLKRQNRSRSLAGQQQQVAPVGPPPAFKLMRLVQDNGDNAYGIESGGLYDIQAKRRPAMDEEAEEIIDLDRHLADEALADQLMRSQNLVSAKPTGGDELAGGEQADEQAGQEDGSISLASRSMHLGGASGGGAGGADPRGLTRAQISNILYGRQMGGQRGLAMGNFIKKTEPQKMTFMHFG